MMGDTLEVVDSIGIELGDSNYVFGSIREIDRGPDGEVFVLDQAGCCILVYSRQGEFIARIGGYGHGPGEMASPSFFEVLGDGSLCVDDANGWLRFDDEWRFVDARQVGSANLMQTASMGDRQIVGIESTFGDADGTLAITKNISLWTDSTPGEPGLVYFTRVYPVEEPQDVYYVDYDPMLFCVGGSCVCVAPDPRDDAVILVYSMDGTPMDTLLLDYPLVPKSERELAEEIAFIESTVSTTTSGEGSVDWTPSPHRDMIRSIGVDSLGMLWVQRGFEPIPTFDVFDPVGHELVGTTRLPDRSDADDWAFDISGEGIVAHTFDPELYYQVYLIE
jgi:hypothetical protein